jgi:hypothetical protein
VGVLLTAFKALLSENQKLTLLWIYLAPSVIHAHAMRRAKEFPGVILPLPAI